MSSKDSIILQNILQYILQLILLQKLLNDYGGAVFMDLSRAFDTLNHGLLIAKLCVWLQTWCIQIYLQWPYKQMAQNEN